MALNPSPPTITLTPAQVLYCTQVSDPDSWNVPNTGVRILRVGQPMFLVKPDFEPLDPDVSLKMERG